MARPGPPGPCVHSGSGDDRPSIAVDNDPASPFYGNTYVSWNDFAIGSGALVFSRSVDGGVTWSAEQFISNTATFIRNTQLAVQPANGQVDLVGVDEGGGGLNPRTNYFFRSQDGGVTWSSPIAMGAPFPAAGDTVDGYLGGLPQHLAGDGLGEPRSGRSDDDRLSLLPGRRKRRHGGRLRRPLDRRRGDLVGADRDLDRAARAVVLAGRLERERRAGDLVLQPREHDRRQQLRDLPQASRTTAGPPGRARGG